jgi:hypothetical protein
MVDINIYASHFFSSLRWAIYTIIISYALQNFQNPPKIEKLHFFHYFLVPTRVQHFLLFMCASNATTVLRTSYFYTQILK